jgi:hypothetical protein
MHTDAEAIVKKTHTVLLLHSTVDVTKGYLCTVLK